MEEERGKKEEKTPSAAVTYRVKTMHGPTSGGGVRRNRCINMAGRCSRSSAFSKLTLSKQVRSVPVFLVLPSTKFLFPGI